MNTRRIERLQEQIKQRVAEVVAQELADPRKGFITITRVKLDTTVEHCVVYFSVLGDSKARRENQAVLDRAARHVQREIAQILTVRTVPHVKFVYDESIEGAVKMQGLLERLRKEREERSPPAEGEAPDAPPADDETDAQPPAR